MRSPGRQSTPTGSARRRQPISHRYLRSFAAIMLGLGSWLMAIGVSAPHAAATDATAPAFEPDSHATGTLTFYDADGGVVSSGSTSATPSIVYAVGSTKAGAGYTNATLYGGTPKSGTDPLLWGNESISAGLAFSPTPADLPASIAALADAGYPVMIGSSKYDESLDTYVSDYPNTETAAGLANIYELRVILTGSTVLTATDQYQRADILVDPTAHTWTQVYPAPTGGGGIPAATATTLTFAPASPQTSAVGTDVSTTATATLAITNGTLKSGFAGSIGKVQFKINGTTAGAAVAVTGDGSTAHPYVAAAALSLPHATVTSDDAVEAAFAPASGSGLASSNVTEHFTINQPTNSGPAATTTALSFSPASPQTSATGTALSTTATATITINSGGSLASGFSSAIGAMQFKVNGTASGSPVNVTGDGSAAHPYTATGSLSLPHDTATSVDEVAAVFAPATGSGLATSTGTAQFTVNAPAGGSAATSSIALIFTPASPQASPAGATVKVTAKATITVTGSPASTFNASIGTVQFVVDGVNTGVAVAVTATAPYTATTQLTLGNAAPPITHVIKAVFSAASASGIGGSNTTSNYVINQGSPVTLAAPASPDTKNPSYYPFTVSVTGTPATGFTGTSLGTVKLLAGQRDTGISEDVPATGSSPHSVTITLIFYTPGTYTFAAQFTPAANSGLTAATSASVSVTVPTPGAAQKSTIALTAPASGTVASGQTNADVPVSATVTLPAGFTGSNPGTVHFSDNGTPITGALALTTSPWTQTATLHLAAGTHSITAAFTPAHDTSVAASSSTIATVTVTVATANPTSPPPATSSSNSSGATLTGNGGGNGTTQLPQTGSNTQFAAELGAAVVFGGLLLLFASRQAGPRRPTVALAAASGRHAAHAATASAARPSILATQHRAVTARRGRHFGD